MTRVAVITVIIENTESVEKFNDTLHDYRDIIIARMGLPYKEKNLNIVCLVVDAEMEKIDQLNDKIEGLDGLSSKTVIQK
jgi:putative iron-only hydrogenase system regulator